MKKRTLALLLCAVLTAASCGGSGAANDGTSSDSAETTTSAPETELTDNLPDVNMDGFELKIQHFNESWLTWAETVMDAESLNGDILNDALYNRNKDIEERFNCTITIDAVDRIDSAAMQTVAMSGDAPYDVYFNYDVWLTGALDYLLEWEKLPYVNLDAEWWNPSATEVFNIGGKTYSAAGNYSLSVISRAAGFMFNKAILEDIQGDNIYDLVREGKWTLDKFCENSKKALRDLDGNGEMDDEDQYGSTGSWKEYMNRIVLGAGIEWISKDSDGYPVFTLPDDEAAIDKLLTIFDKIMDMDVYYAEASSNIDNDGAKGSFKNGKVLFYNSNPFGLEGYRSSDLDIGFVPNPKYDEAQERYYSPAFGAEVSVLPITLPEERYENVGILLEALCFASQQTVVPTYKEVVLKTKSARDNDSADMIDIVFESVSFDFGINAWQNQVSSPLIQGIYSNRSGNVASTLASLKSSVESTIEKLVATVSE